MSSILEKDFEAQTIDLKSLVCDVSCYLLEKADPGSLEYETYLYVKDTMIKAYVELGKGLGGVN